jgi:hypothetical protein
MIFEISATTSLTSCEDLYPSPYFLGSTDGDTFLLSMDVDSNENILVGGYSQSINLVMTTNPTPVVALINWYTGIYTWSKYFNSEWGKIVEVRFQNVLETKAALMYFDHLDT